MIYRGMSQDVPSDIDAQITALRSSIADLISLRTEATILQELRAEIAQLQADKAAISRTAAAYLHEIEQAALFIREMEQRRAPPPRRPRLLIGRWPIASGDNVQTRDASSDLLPMAPYETGIALTWPPVMS